MCESKGDPLLILWYSQHRDMSVTGTLKWIFLSYQLDQSISLLRVVEFLLFIFNQLLIEHSVCKQVRY